MNALLRDATKILCEGTDDSYVKVQTILEDVESPITKTYKEKLFESIISRAHIDFGDIPRSKGDITKYSGYQSMLDCLHSLLKVANEEKSKELTNAVNTVLAAIENIRALRNVYVKAYANKTDIAIIDYQTYVLTCVEATTTLISNYIDFIKTPSSNYVMELKNTKFRANALYLDQLERFNKVNVNGSYNKYISTVVQKGQENFLLDPAIIAGAAFVSVIALSIIPVTRELIYLYNETKRKLSDLFALQAYYLEMNKTALEYNTEIKADKKKVIIQKQDKIRKKFIYLSEKLRIADIKAEQTSKKRLETDNRGMSTGSLEDDVNDSDMVLM
nr:MAG TPA: hypothetical protein [Caudoviricetes sp.]